MANEQHWFGSARGAALCASWSAAIGVASRPRGFVERPVANPPRMEIEILRHRIVRWGLDRDVGRGSLRWACCAWPSGRFVPNGVRWRAPGRVLPGGWIVVG